MERAKLTVRAPRLLLERAKRYAEAHDTTLTRLVTEYLCRLGTHDDGLADAPVVRRLSGVDSRDVGAEEHREHLWRRYGDGV